MRKEDADRLLAMVTDYMDRKTASIAQQLAELRAEIVARKYCGVHQRAMDYQRHNMVTSNGHLWIAVRDNPGVPGEGDGWQLAVRAGRDAR